MKILNGKPTGEIDVKRFYLDGTIITGTCKKCGNSLQKDLGHDYLDYPPMNKPFKDYLYCSECDEGHEVELILSVKLLLANTKTSKETGKIKVNIEDYRGKICTLIINPPFNIEDLEDIIDLEGAYFKGFDEDEDGTEVITIHCS